MRIKLRVHNDDASYERCIGVERAVRDTKVCTEYVFTACIKSLVVSSYTVGMNIIFCDIVLVGLHTAWE